LPLVLIGAVAALIIAWSRYRWPAGTTDWPSTQAAAPGPAESSDDWPISRRLPGMVRSVPRFVPAGSQVQAPNTIHADLMADAASRQAAEALFEQQSRDLGWAPRMEQHLRDRLGLAALENLGLRDLALRIAAIECRNHGCQLQVEWSRDLPAARGRPLFPPDGSPVRYLNDNAGPLGAALMRHSRQEGSDRRVHETFLVFYKADLREPEAWPPAPNPGSSWPAK
jgi:hypothetical protein